MRLAKSVPKKSKPIDSFYEKNGSSIFTNPTTSKTAKKQMIGDYDYIYGNQDLIKDKLKKTALTKRCDKCQKVMDIDTTRAYSTRCSDCIM